MKIVDCQQYTPEWWEARRGIPTSSVASSIITPARGEYSEKGSQTLIYELLAQVGDPNYAIYEDYQTAAMRNGKLLEPEARRLYAFEHDAEVHHVGLCLTDDGLAGCSPDALVGEDGGLEVKSPERKTHIGYLLGGGLPARYRPQVHWCLAVTGRKWWDFMSYCPGLTPLIVPVKPDDYTEKTRECMRRFLADLEDAKKKLQRVSESFGSQHAAAVSAVAAERKEANDVALFG